MLLLEFISWFETPEASDSLTRFEWMLISSNFLLVLITGFYAFRTHHIAKKAGEQAKATKEMAVETRNMAQVTRDQLDYNQIPFMLVKHSIHYTHIGTAIELKLRIGFANKGSLPIELIQGELLFDEEFYESQVRPTTMHSGANGFFEFKLSFENKEHVFDFIVYYKNALSGKLYYTQKSMMWNEKMLSLNEFFNYSEAFDLPSNLKPGDYWFKFLKETRQLEDPEHA